MKKTIHNLVFKFNQVRTEMNKKSITKNCPKTCSYFPNNKKSAGTLKGVPMHLMKQKVTKLN